MALGIDDVEGGEAGQLTDERDHHDRGAGGGRAVGAGRARRTGPPRSRRVRPPSARPGRAEQVEQRNQDQAASGGAEQVGGIHWR